jgi:hypothetical protein
MDIDSAANIACQNAGDPASQATQGEAEYISAFVILFNFSTAAQ